MQIGVEEAAKILNITPDELLFMAQNQKRIDVGIDEDSMTWQFSLANVLSLKESMDAECGDT